MTAGLFVTGTDTDCGKTHVARMLVRLLRDQGIRVAGFKPVAAGAAMCDGKFRNDDALTLIAESGLQLPYDMVNPYCFAPAIAPHLAAGDIGVAIGRDVIHAAFDELAGHVDVVIVEGAGGWLVPLGDDCDIADLAADLGLPVLMVVGLRLGCINHARLTERAILAAGVPLAGWVGSAVDPDMARRDDNIIALQQRLLSPCLGILPHPGAAPSGLDKVLTFQQIAQVAGLPGR